MNCACPGELLFITMPQTVHVHRSQRLESHIDLAETALGHGGVPELLRQRWLYPFHIRRKRALMSTGSLGGLCPFAGTAATGHAHP